MGWQEDALISGNETSNDKVEEGEGANMGLPTLTENRIVPNYARRRAEISPFLDKRLQDAQQHPWRYSFITLLRDIGARHAHLPTIGCAQRPQEEVFRLGQQASLVFAPREIASITVRDKTPEIRMFGLGMLGPNGPLPIHYTEFVRERGEAARDTTVADFLDIFHHRSMTHLYRAWSQSQSAAGLDRVDDETFTPYVARLAGDEAAEVAQGTALPTHARWATSAHRIRQSRNPDGLVSSLSRFFGVKVAMREYQMHWISVENEDECRLGIPGHARTLAQGALLGEVVPDRQTKFRLVIGPLSLDQYLGFTPQGDAAINSNLRREQSDDYDSPKSEKTKASSLHALVDLVRAFIGFEYEWEVELLVQENNAEPAVLGGPSQLGWSSWMGNRPVTMTQQNEEGITGMIFIPENYIASAQQAV